MADKNIIVVKVPRPTTEKFILLVSRGGGGMFGSPRDTSTAFFVDKLEYLIDNRGNPYAVRGLKHTGADPNHPAVPDTWDIVTEFPFGLPYIMTPRSRVRFIDQVAAAKENRAEQDAVSKVYEMLEPEGPTAVEQARGHTYL